MNLGSITIEFDVLCFRFKIDNSDDYDGFVMLWFSTGFAIICFSKYLKRYDVVYNWFVIERFINTQNVCLGLENKSKLCVLKAVA